MSPFRNRLRRGGDFFLGTDTITAYAPLLVRTPRWDVWWD